MPNLPATGGFAIPDGAPRESSQPLSPELIAQQAELARRNERELPPFNPPQTRPVPPPAKGIGARVKAKVDEFFGPAADVVQTAPEAPVGAPPAVDPTALASVEPAALPPPEPHQRAASDSDSPSRGIPKPPTPGKEITGGFGHAAEALYYPLDGFELGQILCAKLDALKAQIQNDLRFSMALTYPRVRAVIEIALEGFADTDRGDYVIKCVPVEHGKTPIEVARERAEEVVFVLLDAHLEMLPDGESVTPPNAARIEAGLPVPMKQRNEAGYIVDRQ